MNTGLFINSQINGSDTECPRAGHGVPHPPNVHLGSVPTDGPAHGHAVSGISANIRTHAAFTSSLERNQDHFIFKSSSDPWIESIVHTKW